MEWLVGITKRFRPGELIQEIQACGEAVLQARGEAVVALRAGGIHPGDRAETLIGPARLYSEGLAGLVGNSLIVVRDDGQADSRVAAVGYFEDSVFHQLPLDGREQGPTLGPSGVTRRL